LNDLKKVQVLLTTEQYKQLKKLAYETETSMSDQVRQALDKHFKVIAKGNKGKGG
jgi:hypothetical protein